MNNIEIIAALSRLGINKEASETSLDLSGANWKEIVSTAMRSGVLPTVFDGMEKLSSTRRDAIPSGLFYQAAALTTKIEEEQRRKTQAVREMTEFFDSHGLPIMILKGYSHAILYPLSEHRPGKDIDIWQFGKFREGAMALQKYKGIETHDDQHHHTTFHWGEKLYVENHYDFINIHSHPSSPAKEKILKRYAAEPLRRVDGILIPNPFFTALFALVHTGAHFAAESTGLRYLLDWYLIRRDFRINLPSRLEELENVFRECGIYRFYKIWDAIAVAMFDADAPQFDVSALSDEECRVLAEVINPRFEAKIPKGFFKGWSYRLRRWMASRWKMRIVYGNENLLHQFLVHSRMHLLNPSRLLARRQSE